MGQGNIAAHEENVDVEEIEPGDILKILKAHEGDVGGLISILQEIQSAYGYLPAEALWIVARQTGRSMVDIYGVATFYRSFSLKPRGRHLVCACLGTACHVRGAPRVVDELEQQLGIKAGQTTEDKEFTLETVNCLGACALGPVVVIDGHYFSKVTRARIRPLLDKALEGFDTTELGNDERIFPIEVSCPHCDHSLMDEGYTIDGHPSIKVTISMDHRDGWLRLSCLYGSYNFSSEFEVPVNTVVRFFCPSCREELPSTSDCPTCGAPMVPMLVSGGGIVKVCSRRGCRNHMLDLI